MMDFRLLGPLEVEGSGGLVQVTGAKERALLALLLVRANRLVSRELLIDELWGDNPPATARHSLQVYVSRLRRVLAASGNGGVLQGRPGGYRICLEENELDVFRFERLLEQGRAALEGGALEEAEERFAAALALWRGPVLADLADEPFAEVEAQRLEELRLAGVEARLDVALRLGHDAELVAELQSLVAANPLRERLRAQLMLALYRSGRQADALAVYREGRSQLVDELGIEPGRELQELEQAILRHDQALDSPATVTQAPAAPASGRGNADAPPAAAVPERRKIVTVVFCDVLGSAAERLDPERLRVSLDSFFERMKATAEFHGGAVAGVVGNAAMAVFGVPVAHEDDALRACRAGLEMQRGLSELGLQGRIGVNSGEAVTGVSERLAIGEAVEVTAQLQQAAQPGEVLIGDATLDLARGLIEVESADALTMPTTGSVPAYRLLSVAEVEKSRPSAEARFVGRVPELALLEESWRQVLAGQRCELVTILGDAGIGKSRLVAEALRSLEARVVQSRCPPYGEGITYWPVVEVAKQLDTLPSGPAAGGSIRALLGETERATTGEEIAWAFRKLLEQEAPLVVVFDDVHSGEETFLDLVESVALLSSGAPILLLCLARPELLAKRPDWPVTLRLDPLTDEQVLELIGDRVPERVRAQIAGAAGGNPLFITELLAMASDSSQVDVPPTLRALLAARLDQLDPAERRLLDRAAVEGEVFHRRAVQALDPDETQVTHHLASLIRRKLIRPDSAEIAGEDGFRFCHLLICDTAYDGLPKSTRAELHERYAGWLGGHTGGLVEPDELLGYHLEQACRYRRELGRPVDAELAARAREHLTAAGGRALLRGDAVAACSLLERAIAAGDPEDVPVALQHDLVNALFLEGSLPEGLARIAELLQTAEASRDAVRVLCWRIVRAMWRTFVEPEGAAEALEALLEEAMPVLEAAGDDFALYLAWFATWLVAEGRGLMDDAVEAGERSIEYARRAGLPHRMAYMVPFVEVTRVLGSTSASDLLACVDEQERTWDYGALLLAPRGWPLTMLGRSDEARSVLDGSLAQLPPGSGQWSTMTIWQAGEIELLLDDASAAADLLERACTEFEQMGERRQRASSHAQLARAQYKLGRLDEAERNVRLAAEVSASDDAVPQVLWRQVDAKLHAGRGEYVEAERLAGEAVAIADRTQMLNAQADAYADLAEVLALAGKSDAACEALHEAVGRYERKENLVGAKRARARLAELEGSAVLPAS